MSVPDWRQPQGLRGRPGFKPTCRAEFAAWTASGRAGRGAGRPRQGLAGLRDDAPSERSATKRRRCGGHRGACGACRGAGGRRQDQGWIRDDAPSHTSATMHHWFGGRRRVRRARPGFETTRQANDQQPSTGGVEAATGPAGPGRGAGGRRQDQGWIRDDAPSERSATKHRRCGGCRGACGAWPRCRRAAAGPGRASRSITPSRRLACGDLAGGRARRRPENPWCHKPRPKVRTPRSTPDSGRPGGRRGDRGR